jgi:hypothetical protein
LSSAAKESAKVVPGIAADTFNIEYSLEELRMELAKKTARDQERAERRRRGSATEYSLELTDSQIAELKLGKLLTKLKGMRVPELVEAMQSELNFRNSNLHDGAMWNLKSELVSMCSAKIGELKAAIEARSMRRHSPRK